MHLGSAVVQPVGLWPLAHMTELALAFPLHALSPSLSLAYLTIHTSSAGACLLPCHTCAHERQRSGVALSRPLHAGAKDPGPPQRGSGERQRTYRTKSETAEKKPITGTIVLALLAIAVVVPMVQYWGYTSKE